MAEAAKHATISPIQWFLVMLPQTDLVSMLFTILQNRRLELLFSRETAGQPSEARERSLSSFSEFF
jgi:hypothetical protein